MGLWRGMEALSAHDTIGGPTGDMGVWNDRLWGFLQGRKVFAPRVPERRFGNFGNSKKAR